MRTGAIKDGRRIARPFPLSSYLIFFSFLSGFFLAQ